MRRFACLATLALGLALPGAAAFAETPEAGRYLVVEMPVPGSTSGTKQTMMVDTQYGRTWVLVQEGGSTRWKRVYYDADNNAPQGLQRRPPPVTPSTPN